MNSRMLLVAPACGIALSFANLAIAQQVQERTTQVKPGQQVQAQGQLKAGPVGQQAQWQNTDQTLATCIAIANQEEIAIAKLAEEKAKNKDVKDFAKMLATDHKAFLQKLQQYAPEATQDGYLNEQQQTNRNDQRTSANDRRESSSQSKVQPAGGKVQAGTEVRTANGAIQQTSATQPGAGSEANQPLNFVQLHREIAEECIRCAKHEMSKKDGTEFDECFVGHQIAAHEDLKTKLVVFQRHASGELSQIIADGIEVTEKHKKRAEDLMKTLDDSDSGSKRDRNDEKK